MEDKIIEALKERVTTVMPELAFTSDSKLETFFIRAESRNITPDNGTIQWPEGEEKTLFGRVEATFAIELYTRKYQSKTPLIREMLKDPRLVIDGQTMAMTFPGNAARPAACQDYDRFSVADFDQVTLTITYPVI